MLNQITLLLAINNLSAIGYSLIAPLYPPLAVERGIEEYVVGIIFATFAISNVFTIPFAP
jgi:hypothetical protein